MYWTKNLPYEDTLVIVNLGNITTKFGMKSIEMKHKKTASSFVLNIQKAMRVVGGGGNEFPTKMTQEELAKASGIARSTLALHKELEADKGRAPNPTLEKICKIAETLNVPPAFLLMRGEDWTRLAQAVEYYATLKESKKIYPFLSKIANSSHISPTDQATMAFNLAKLLEIDGRPSKELLNSLDGKARNEVDAEATSRKLSIYAASSLPPINYMKADEKIAAFIVSVIFGAHYKAGI
ncbi:MAG: XRE family transcriptional regulator [Oxalobacteraceae bacterium]|jgi:transcriptional regulator with XRE-family HTH domain|nr:MAG: XRE family transcriptional regulator [Oxalobacteraceae bacterium]